MSAPQFDRTPFSLPGNDTGCLLIHGFTATPYDMRFFGERLHRCGFSVSAVCLPGHGSRVEEMERYSWQDWYAAAADSLRQLATTSSRCVVVGQSMGALLALKLAHDHPGQVTAVVPISTALVASSRVFDWIAPVVPVIRPLLPRPWRFLKKGLSDIADPQARAEGQAYRHIPLRSVHQLYRLQRHVRTILPNVRQPALAIHARQDHACPVDNVAILERELGGPVRTLMLDNSFHVVSVDCDKEQAIEAICAFVSEL